MADRPNPHRMNQPDQDSDTSDIMRSEVRRQRNIILLCAVVLLLGILFGFGGILGGEKDENGPPTNGQAQQGKPIPSDGTPAEASKYCNQFEATVTETTTVLAWPWQDRIKAENWLPSDQQWMPDFVEHIANGLINQNRVLEAGSTQPARNFLPRSGHNLEPDDLQKIACAAESRNLLIVEFLRDGAGWRVHGYRWGVTPKNSDPLVTREMPAENRVKALSADIATAISELSDWDIKLGPSLTESDAAAKVLLTLETEANRIYQSSDHDKMLERLSGLVEEANGYEPTWDYPTIRFAQYMRSVDKTKEVIAFVRRKLDSECGSDRLRQELATLLVHTADPNDYREGLDRLLDLVSKDRLNMTAYQIWGASEYAAPAGPGLDSKGDIARARDGIKNYPEDGRFHGLMASLLSVDPEYALTAIDYVEQAQKLRPWNTSIGYHKGMALYTTAWSGVNDNSLTPESAAQVYWDAANAFAEAWHYNTNRLENWVPVMFRCLTQNETRLPESIINKSGEVSHLVGFIYMLGLVAEEFLNPTEIRRGMARFRNHRPQLDAYVRTQAEKITPESNNFELFLLADAALAFREYSQRRAAQPEPEITQSEVDRVTNAISRYRATGARATEVETRWAAIQAIAAMRNRG